MEQNKFSKVGVLKNLNATILAPQASGLKLVLATVQIDGKLTCPMIPLVNKRWGKFRTNLASMYNTRTGDFKYGFVSELCVQSDVWIMNMVCRDDHGLGVPTALKTCLANVKKVADYEHASVHVSQVLLDALPKLAGLLQTELIDKGVSVSTYTEPKL